MLKMPLDSLWNKLLQGCLPLYWEPEYHLLSADSSLTFAKASFGSVCVLFVWSRQTSVKPVSGLGTKGLTTAKSVPAETKFPTQKALNTSTQTSPPWWSCLPLQRHGFDWQTYRIPRSLCRMGWPRPLMKGLSRISKLKEKIIYFYCLSVNDNSCSSTNSNDSQNGIHCCQQTAIIQTNLIHSKEQ